MYKDISKFLTVAVICATLAIFWHAATMNQTMKDGDGMSASCLASCFIGGKLEAPVIESGTMILQTVALAAMIFVFLTVSFAKKEIDLGFFQKDRHRYLMKTMVMLR
jgi:hypothetical protein